MPVVLNHAVSVFIIALVSVFRLHVRAKVHPCAIPPAEEWLASSLLTLDKVLRRGERLFVDRLHSLLVEWSGVLDLLAALAVGLTFKNPARAVALFEVLPLAITMSPG